MGDCGGFAFIGLLFALLFGTVMGANPLVGAIVLSLMFGSICLN